MSSLASEASLIVAAFDLFAVKAVIGASRAADLASGDFLTPVGIVEKPGVPPTPIANENLVGTRPDPKLLLIRQNVYSPTPRLCNLHKSCRVAPVRVEVPICDLAPEPGSAPSNPIEPPWKVLPWMDRSPNRFVFVKEIKVITTGSDMSFRGTMIDVVA